ncbi:hypothetical protein ACP8Y2_16625 [Herpetosiphon llansteffanensis]
MNTLKHQHSRHWPRHIQTVSWIILIQLALFCPLACIAHCWWSGMQSQTAVAEHATMLVCDLHAQHSDSAPQPMPPLPDGLAAVYPMVLLLLTRWMLAPRLWRRLLHVQRVWPSYHPQIITPPPRILVLG